MVRDVKDEFIFCETDLALTTDLSAVTKREFVNDRSKCKDVKVIRVEFVGSGDERVLVRRRSHDERRESDSSLR